MKKYTTKGAIILGVIVVSMLGCNKTGEIQQTTTSVNSDITIITDQFISDMDSQDVYADDPGNGIYMKDEGIAPNFLIDETDLEGKDTLRTHIRDHSIIKCLKGLSLTESQKSDVLKELRSYKDCKEDAVQRAKAIYRKLHEIYKVKFARLYDAFKNGTITRDEFKTQSAKLRAEFKKELRSLHLKAKLDETFKKCFRELLGGIHSILTESQWNAFVACCKSKS
jgi:hypothetical protein